MKRDKAIITVAIPKPRNPIVSILASKRGGAHRKDNKALRAQSKHELRKQLRTGKSFGSFFSPIQTVAT